MEPGWTPVIAAVIGGLIVLSGSWFTEYKRQLLEKRKLLVTKIEEIYLLTTHLNILYSKDLERAAKKIHNVEMTQEINHPVDVHPLIKSKMLVEIYFPSLRISLDALSNSNDDFYQFFAQVFCNDYSHYTEKNRIKEREIMELKWTKLRDEILDFQKAITKEGNKTVEHLTSSSFFVLISKIFTRK